MSKNTKIFCISYPRTGTKSITEAFSDLGYKAWTFRKDINAVLGVLKGESFSRKILDFYDFFVDVPIFLVYKKLDKLCPGSKFILITRDKSNWFSSMNKMLNSAKKYKDYKKINDLVWPDFYPGSIVEHTEDVKAYFFNRKNDLLIEDLTKINYDILCNFLNIESNKKEFPHI